ncbi:efflux RND transporter periplasmic adaptor subunit [Glaciecola siphonariae]|uniref:Efflux RND transporter periplasmic adaptor subunit n=1 Tax=Glaciecola siphonariae TaxID=521012 RepID=A0ABV9LTR0_9ALTE
MMTKLYVLSVLTMFYFINTASASVPVTVEPVQYDVIETKIMVTGTVHGKQDVVLTAGIDGRLTYLAEPGERIEKGGVLASIDTFALEIEKARQQEMMNRANVNLKLHKQELSRIKKLAQTNSAAITQLDILQNRHDLALSDIALAELAIKEIDHQLERAQIKAHFSGVVSQRFIREGREVNRAEELLRFIDTDNLEVRMYVPVKHLPFINKTSKVRFIADDKTMISAANKNTAEDEYANSSGPESYAQIVSIIPATDPRSQTFEVRAKISHGIIANFAVGQLIDAQLLLPSKSAELLVNRDAIIIRQSGTHVARVSSEGKVDLVSVQVGLGAEDLVAVRAIPPNTLSESDKVVVRGAERLTQGQEVNIQNMP